MDNVIRRTTHCSLIIQFKDIEDWIRSNYPQLPENIYTTVCRNSSPKAVSDTLVDPDYININWQESA